MPFPSGFSTIEFMAAMNIGGTASRLTKLLEEGFPIPKGFIVSAETQAAFFNTGNLKDKIQLLIERCDFGNPQDIATVSKVIKKLILAAEMPTLISEPLLKAAMKLGKDRVMLTPSPLAPDSTVNVERLFGLTGEATILLGIRELWASQFNSEELYTISSSGEFPLMAICVQIQPRGLVSGTLVTSDNDKTTCTVRAVWNEGAYLSKLQGADIYHIERTTGKEKEKIRSIQTKEWSFQDGKAENLKVPESRQKKQKLPDNALMELAKLAGHIQQKMFFPQEVTFTFDGRKIFLLDLKPSTVTEASEEPILNVARRVLLKGLGMSPGIITGMVRIVRPGFQAQPQGDILVASKLIHLDADLLREARGVIIEEEVPPGSVFSLINKGVAFLASAAGAVDLLEPGMFVTLHSPRGEVWAGGYTNLEPEPQINRVTHSAMRIGTSLSLGFPSRRVGDPLNGHLLISAEKLISDLGAQTKLNGEKKLRLFTDTIAKTLTQVSKRYKEEKLMYGFSSHSTLWPAEIKALEQIGRENSAQRISLMLPPVRTAFEVLTWSRLLSDKLPRSARLRYFLDLSTPSMIWQLPQVAGILDGVIFDLDALAKNLFVSDVDTLSRYQSVDLEPTMFATLRIVEQMAKEEGFYLILKGQMLEHDPYLSFAVQRGIHEINVPETQLGATIERVLVLEQELISHV